MPWWAELLAYLPVLGFLFRCLCCPVVCQHCLSVTPAELIVVVAGQANGVSSTCDVANGTWALPYGGCSGSNAVWFAAFPDEDDYQCGAGLPVTPSFTVQISWVSGTGTRTIRVNSNSFGGTTFELVETGQSEPFDCTSFVSFEVPADPPGTICCDGSAATCHITSN